MWKTVKTYVISILFALTVGVLSALITRGNMMIYGEIIKPPTTQRKTKMLSD